MGEEAASGVDRLKYCGSVSERVLDSIQILQIFYFFKVHVIVQVSDAMSFIKEF